MKKKKILKPMTKKERIEVLQALLQATLPTSAHDTQEETQSKDAR